MLQSKCIKLYKRCRMSREDRCNVDAVKGMWTCRVNESNDRLGKLRQILYATISQLNCWHHFACKLLM